MKRWTGQVVSPPSPSLPPPVARGWLDSSPPPPSTAQGCPGPGRVPTKPGGVGCAAGFLWFDEFLGLAQRWVVTAAVAEGHPLARVDRDRLPFGPTGTQAIAESWKFSERRHKQWKRSKNFGARGFGMDSQQEDVVAKMQHILEKSGCESKILDTRAPFLFGSHGLFKFKMAKNAKEFRDQMDLRKLK